ncbi:MAG: hypothetical protein JRF41_10740, partial [Deltaproteobacteria bacterium]|nr:hypothetical protein [Deltaproteobacteria bacterium]
MNPPQRRKKIVLLVFLLFALAVLAAAPFIGMTSISLESIFSPGSSSVES